MDTFIYSAIGLGSLWTIFNVNKGVNGLQEKFKQLENSPTFLPDGLISFLKQIEKTGLLDHNGFTKNESNPDEISGNVFLKGIASTRHPIKSKLMPQLPLIYSSFHVNKIYSNNVINDQILSHLNHDDILQQNLFTRGSNSLNECIVDEAPYFNLHGFETYNDEASKTTKLKKKFDVFCRVARNLNIDARGAARLITNKVYYKSLSLVERFIVFVYLILEAIFSRQATVKGISIGYIEHEMGIRNDSLLDVYGKVTYNTKKNTLQMDYPEYFLRNKNIILMRILRTIRDKKIIIMFLFIPLLISIWKLGSKALKWIKAWNDKRQKIIRDRMNMIKKIVIDDIECRVCHSNIINLILLPCEHFCICKGCYLHRIEEKKCPKCYSSITEIIEVFLP